MTKKHFVALAEIVAFLINDIECGYMNHKVLLNHITSFCSSQNARFNRDTFEDAVAKRLERMGYVDGYRPNLGKEKKE